MDKKKKLQPHSHKDEPEKKEPPRFVTQVVEIIELDDAQRDTTPLPAEKSHKEHTEEPAKDFEEVSNESFEDEREESVVSPHSLNPKNNKQEDETGTTPEPELEEQSEEQPEEQPEPVRPPVKQKQVVEELFSNRDTASVTEISIHKKTKKTPVALWAGIVLGVALLTGLGMIALTQGFGQSQTGIGKTPTPTLTTLITPSPTPEQAPAKDSLKVQVLNGGGVPGAATKMRKTLEEAGYTVAAVGNAQEYTFEETEVQVKSGKLAISEMVEKDVAKTYTIASESSPLSSDSEYDVVVVVGKK